MTLAKKVFMAIATAVVLSWSLTAQIIPPPISPMARAINSLTPTPWLPMSRAASGALTLAWNALPGTNVLYRIYGTTNAAGWLLCNEPGVTNCPFPSFSDLNTNRTLLWFGYTTIAVLGAGTNWSGWHMAVTGTASYQESSPSTEIAIGQATVNRVTAVRAQSAPSINGPWSNGPVVFTGTNVTGTQFWRLAITSTNL